MILDDAVVSSVAAGIRAGTGEEPSSFAFPGTTDATYLVPASVPCVICGQGDSKEERWSI
jgi:acetylornithine deacetylase/succinyl-diaminopimelate desuccinylase-like protein